jgi:vacuolar-type H+-ATPase subunit H
MQNQSQDNHENDNAPVKGIDNVDSLLDQALLLSTGPGSDLDAARASRSQAEAMLAEMEREARRVGEDNRKRLLDEAEKEKQAADQLLKTAQEDRDRAKHALEEARKAKASAAEYLEKAEKDADKRKEEILDRAKASAEKEANKIREKAHAEIQKKLGELETLKMAAREELEARRLLTRAAVLRAKYTSVTETGPEQEITDSLNSEAAKISAVIEKPLSASKRPQKVKMK